MTIIEMVERLRRFGSQWGFGVQSPNDYRFVCNVVNERYPYDVFPGLKKKYPHLNKRMRSKAEMLLRIANFIQPDIVINRGMNPVYNEYISSGCSKVIICHNDAIDVDGLNECDVIDKRFLLLVSCTDIDAGCESDIADILKYVKHGTCLIVDNVHTDKDANKVWQKLISHVQCTIAFDLYDIGVILSDSKRFKTMYKINRRW